MKSPEKGQENAHEYEHEDAHDGNKVGYAVRRGREDGEFALGREGAEASAGAGTAKRETVNGSLITCSPTESPTPPSRPPMPSFHHASQPPLMPPPINIESLYCKDKIVLVVKALKSNIFLLERHTAIVY
jgi:hypothetical protein